MRRIGTCSICGGSVMGVGGPWYRETPQPPDKCSGCGAVAQQTDVIQMVPSSSSTRFDPEDEALYRLVPWR